MSGSFGSTFWEGGGWDVVPSVWLLPWKTNNKLLNVLGTNGEANEDSSNFSC